MFVYIVEHHMAYEGSILIGVFDNLDNAKEAADDYAKKNLGHYSSDTAGVFRVKLNRPDLIGRSMYTSPYANPNW